MLKVTPAASEKLKEQLEPHVKDGEELFVRLFMGIG